MDDQTSEEIKNQMSETRAKLADKLETLEEQIVEPAAAAVTETVATVKEAVDNTSDAVKSALKKMTETFDLSAHVKKYPWRIMGASVATGFFWGHVSKSRGPEFRPQQVPVSPLVIASPVTERDTQQNHLDGIYAARVTAAESPSDHKTLAESWNIGTSFQTILMQALVPICQGLVGAVVAEFFRQSTKQPGRAAGQATAGQQRRTAKEELDQDEWIDPDIEREEPDWGQRLRSTPR